MNTLNSVTDLRKAIIQLENKQLNDGRLLKEQFTATYDSLKPANILKNIFKEATVSGDLKGNMLNTSLGLITGSFAKKIFEKGSANPIRKIIGSALMFAVTNVVTKHPGTIKSLGAKFWEAIRYKSASKTNNDDQHKNGRAHPASSFNAAE